MEQHENAFIEYRNKVVDLSRRNRLLKYPKNGKAIVFKSSLTEFFLRNPNLEELCIEFNHKDLFAEDEASGQLFKDRPPLIVTTDPTGERLINMLNNLRLESRRKYEEHGLHTLYLSIGQVKWHEQTSGKIGSGDVTKGLDYSAPLLLIPVQIEEKKSPKRTVITTALETAEISTNKTLALLLQKEHGATEPTVDIEVEGIDWQKKIDLIVEETKKIFAEVKISVEITEEIKIGQYSFFGQQIYEDLEKNASGILENEFINALCSNKAIEQANLKVDIESVDDLLTVDNDYNVMDADGSQLMVIQKALQGNHLNVQGPPGTGKSQTIVNLISNLIARKKSILMVCEKQVALDVVLKRLEKTGLDKLCLPLFQHTTDKKFFAKSIIEDRDRIVRDFTQSSVGNGTFEAVLKKRSKNIEKLHTYAKALAELVEPLGRTLHWVHGEVAKHQEKTSETNQIIPWQGPDPLRIDFDDYRELLRILDAFAPLCGLNQDEKHSHWDFIYRQFFSPDFLSRVLQELQDIEATVNSIDKKVLCTESMEEIRELLVLLQTYKKSEHLALLNQDRGIEDLINLLSIITPAADAYIETSTQIGNKYKIPAQWKHTSEHGQIGSLKSESLNSEIDLLNGALSPLAKQLERITLLLDEIDSTQISGLSLEDLSENSEMACNSPTLCKIKNWQYKNKLQEVESKLAAVKTLQTAYLDSKRRLDKWGIITVDIPEDELKNIKGRADKNYSSVLRYLYGSYKADKKRVTEWCNIQTPKNHQELTEVINSATTFFDLQRKMNAVFGSFINEHVHEDVRVSLDELDDSIKAIATALSTLNSKGGDIFTEHVVRVIESASKVPQIRDLSSLARSTNIEWAKLESFFNSSLGNKTALKDLYGTYNKRVETLNKYSTLRSLVDNSLRETIGLDRVIDVQNAAKAIDELSEKYEAFKQTGLSDVFVSPEADSWILESNSQYKSMLASVILLDNFVRKFSHQKNQSCSSALIQITNALSSAQSYQTILDRLNDRLDALSKLSENENLKPLFSATPFIKLNDNIQKMLVDEEGLQKWVTYRSLSFKLQELGHGWFLHQVEEGKVNQPLAGFARSLWNAWLEAHYTKHEILKGFTVRDHHKIIQEFKDLEKEVLEVNALRILHSYAPDLRAAKTMGGDQERELIHQSELRQRHKSIRKVVKNSAQQLLRYKPCWMMSPLTLSSYLPYSALQFDVVIFDEASQLRVEHALGAIARSKQVIIFGDENQLPPTSFFDVTSDDNSDESEEVNDFESILHATKEVLPGADELLSHHYRSKYEELITFSNHYIYNDRLITYPNPNNTNKAVQFDFVENGAFDGGEGGSRKNDIEAQRVVDICIQHVENSPNKTLGVIAFSRSQEIAIRDALIDALKTKPHLQEWLDENSDKPDAFFIKNLESVQGDERDVIFLSIGYGKDKRKGQVFQRFGPINSSHGYRRLNVAVTRAKEKVVCVSSMHASDIRNVENSRGAFLLQKYLEYAERGIAALDGSRLIQASSINIAADSPFEEEVEQALQKRGYTIHRQVGASGFKIDLAVVDPNNSQEYILGIECDGASYHSSYSARMNDRIRQDILTRLDWKLYRIWSQHWITNRENIIEDIIRHIASPK